MCDISQNCDFESYPFFTLPVFCSSGHLHTLIPHTSTDFKGNILLTLGNKNLPPYCFSCLVCIFLSYVYLLYFFFLIYFRRRTAGQRSVFGRSCDRPPRHRFFLFSLCLNANAEMVSKTPSCHYMLLMQPSRLKFSSNQFQVLCTCKITTATG